MWFEGRNLKPHADSVGMDTLALGSVYFTVTYFDDELTVPEMNTLVYVGKSTREDATASKVRLSENGEIFVFKLAEFLYEDDNAASEHYLMFELEELAGVYTFEAALDELLRCSIRRTKSS